MWNSWMDKAKEMAAKIDNQINESVGLEADGTAPTTTTTTMPSSSPSSSTFNNTTAAAGVVPATSAAVANASSSMGFGTSTAAAGSSSPFAGFSSGNASASTPMAATRLSVSDENAWNEDFDDFGDDDGDDDNTNVDKKQNQEQQQQQVQSPQPTMVPIPPPAPKPKLLIPSVNSTSNSNLSQQRSKSSLVVASSPASVPKPEAEEKGTTETPTNGANQNQTNDQSMDEEGWDQDGVEDIDLEEEEEEMAKDDDVNADKEKTVDKNDEQQQQQEEVIDLQQQKQSVEQRNPTEGKRTTPLEKVSMMPATGQMQEAADGEEDMPSSQPEPEIQPEAEVDAEPSSSSQENHQGVKKTHRPAPLAAASSMLSSLTGGGGAGAADSTATSSADGPGIKPAMAGRAAAAALTSSLSQLKAPKVSGFLSSVVNNAAHLVEDAALSSSDDPQQQQQKQNNNETAATAVSKSMTSLLSSFPAAVTKQSTISTPANDKDAAGGTGGWEEDDDLGMMEDNDESVSATERSVPQFSASASAPGPESITAKTTDDKRTNDTEPVAIHDQVETMSETPQEMPNENDNGVSVESKQQANVGDVEKQQDVATAAVVVGNIEEDPRYVELQRQLTLRENQLADKSEQLTQLQTLWENQEQELRKKIQETKEEAKKRILRAKERCEAAESQLAQYQHSSNDASAQQLQLIAELRKEGEKLAVKQSQMEQAVRAARSESRQLNDELDDETKEKEAALEKIKKLETELRLTKESLSSARKGESQAGKLEQDLLSTKADVESKAGTISSLQQQIKEFKSENHELRVQVESTKKLAAEIASQEKKTLRREHNDVISDLEYKLRTTQREANVREDSLRHEVDELRKRWQDAVRRADALSMDVQSSTAPLLRQLESMERQSRARAAAWSELETRLRTELEETVIENENLSKERTEYKTKFTRLERSYNEAENELKQSKRIIEEQTVKVTKLEAKVDELQSMADKREEEYSKVERLANEGVMRVRSEMTQTVVDSEERYRGQIDKLENELRTEQSKRSQLEKQVEQLLENATSGGASSTMMMMMTGVATAASAGGTGTPAFASATNGQNSKPQRLRKAEGQAEILAGALGFDDSDDEYGIDDDDDDVDDLLGNGGGGGGAVVMERGESGSMNSFAALEQLSSRLKVAKIELETLRKNLKESEEVRQSLLSELVETRVAKEKSPLFEAKVAELLQDNREKELEIQGLREDIAEVKELYRTQLTVLLEEKTTDRNESAAAAMSTSADDMNNNEIIENDISNYNENSTIPIKSTTTNGEEVSSSQQEQQQDDDDNNAIVAEVSS